MIQAIAIALLPAGYFIVAYVGFYYIIVSAKDQGVAVFNLLKKEKNEKSLFVYNGLGRFNLFDCCYNAGYWFGVS